MRWYEGWLKRLAEKYQQPIAVLEQMPIGAFYREIAILFAESITESARWLQEKTSDKKERQRKDREWRKIRQSDEWIDRMIVEKVQRVSSSGVV